MTLKSIDRFYSTKDKFKMFRLVIYPADGNLVVAALFLALITFQWREREQYIPIDEISLSFSTEEAANKFADEVTSNDLNFGCKNTFSESADVIVHPDYNSHENAARTVYHAINAYKDSLNSINRFNLGTFFEKEEVNNFIKNIENYIKEYFGSEAIRIELLNETV
jgi:hypothetical protein